MSRLIAAILISGALALLPAQDHAGPMPPHVNPVPPHVLMERLHNMDATERERLLQRLPPERRASVEKNLRRYEALPAEARKHLQRQFTAFRRMPQERQAEARELFRQLNSIPAERRLELRQEVVRLRFLKPEQREARMASDAFRAEYTEEERALLDRLANLLPAPPAAAQGEAESAAAEPQK